MDLDKMKAEAVEVIAKAKALLENGGSLEEADVLVERAETLKSQIRAEEILQACKDAEGSADGSAVVPGDLHGAMKSAGFDLRSGKTHVELPFEAVGWAAKSDLIATQANANPSRVAGVSEIGRDDRYVTPNLPSEGLQLTDTAIQYLKQTTRTLPAVGDMQLAIDASTAKPVTDSVAALTTVEPIWVATISNPQPRVLFEVPALKQMLNKDMVQAYRNSLDDHVIDTIDGASGANTLNQGADIVADAFYKLANDLVDDGFDPDLLVIGTAAAESLFLAKDADDRYYEYVSNGPLKGIKVVVSPQVAATKGYVVDSSVVTVYRSGVFTDVDPYTEFDTNRVILRVEGLARAVVSQDTGIGILTYA